MLIELCGKTTNVELGGAVKVIEQFNGVVQVAGMDLYGLLNQAKSR